MNKTLWPAIAIVAVASACRPVSVGIDCPVAVEAATEFDVTASLDKSGGNATFDVVFSWTSPSAYRAELIYLAVDNEPLEAPDDDGYLDLFDVGEGDVRVTVEGVACPDPDTACWGALNVEGTVTKSGLFGSDHDSSACEIDITQPDTGP